MAAVDDVENGQDYDTSDASGSDDSKADPVETPPEPLPENVFSVGIACFIRDSKWLMHEGKEQTRYLKFCRLSFTVGITLFALGLQFFLIYETKVLVTPDVVKSIRSIYSQYEQVMYTDYTTNTSYTHLTVNGFNRGNDAAHFYPNNFAFLDDDVKAGACRIPLSQPTFFFAIMAIWTMTCLADMRENVSIMVRLLIRVETVPSMEYSLKECDDGDEIVGLTTCMKMVLLFVIGIPRLLLTGYLLWLGGRWLAATNSFADLILNAVALEFILLLRELLYNTIVPHATKVATTNTLVPHLRSKEGASPRSYFGTFFLLLVAFAYTWLYMYHLQAVLPEYQWDVRAVCADYLENQLTGTSSSRRHRSAMTR